MTKYILRRILLALPTVLLVMFMTFMMLRLVPGSLVDTMMADRPYATAQDRADLEKQLGLDEPIPQQFVKYVWHVARGDLGESPWTSTAVTSELRRRLPVHGGVRPDGDHLWALRFSANRCAVGHPPGHHQRLPCAEFRHPGAVRAVLLQRDDHHRVWPEVGLDAAADLQGMGGGAILPPLLLSRARDLARAFAGRRCDAPDAHDDAGGPSTGLHKDGLGEGPARALRHLPARDEERAHPCDHHRRFAGRHRRQRDSIILETIFNMPGVGRYFVGAILQRDYPSVQGVVLVLATVIVVVNLVIDLSYAWLDPRIRYS